MRVHLSPVLVAGVVAAMIVAEGQRGGADPARSPDEVRRAVREVLGDDALQTELAGPETPPLREGPALRASGAAGRVIDGVAFALLVAAGLGALAMLARAAIGAARGDARAEHVEAPQAELPRAVPALLPDAADLAARGRFAEAMHAVLVRALVELARQMDPPPPDSATARELCARVPVPARAPLSELCARVERVHFGRAPAGAPDVARCRELAQAASGQPAP